MIAYATTALLVFRSGDLIPLGGNRVAVKVGSDQVLSIQPDGSQQTRSVNAIGAWETATKSGDKLVYTPEGRVYVFPIVEGL